MRVDAISIIRFGRGGEFLVDEGFAPGDIAYRFDAHAP